MDTSVVYHMAIERHDERVARGEARERLSNLLHTPSIRDRIAVGLVALARRLSPGAVPVRRHDSSLGSAAPA